MKRILLALLLTLGLSAPALASEILTLPITTAVTAVTGSTFQLRFGPGAQAQNMTLQATLVYGSGGTTVDAWVQTSLDGGSTWTDVANFHFTTVAPFRLVQNVSAVTAVVAAVTAQDGALTANTAVSGMFGNQWRVKVTTTGTYAGGTVLHVDAIGVGLTSSP
jgi:hypothetical protein